MNRNWLKTSSIQKYSAISLLKLQKETPEGLVYGLSGVQFDVARGGLERASCPSGLEKKGVAAMLTPLHTPVHTHLFLSEQ